MPIIKIDGKEYESENLSAEAKKQISAIQVVDSEIRRLQVQLSIANTARSVHAQLLKAALADPTTGDTIKLGS